MKILRKICSNFSNKYTHTHTHTWMYERRKKCDHNLKTPCTKVWSLLRYFRRINVRSRRHKHTHKEKWNPWLKSTQLHQHPLCSLFWRTSANWPEKFWSKHSKMKSNFDLISSNVQIFPPSIQNARNDRSSDRFNDLQVMV